MIKTSYKTSLKHRRHRNYNKRKPVPVTRTNRHRKSKCSHFLRNLAVFIGIVLFMICIFFVKFWQYLAEYQETLPSMLGDEILAAYQECDTTTIKKYANNLPPTLSDDLTLHSYLTQIIGTKDLYYYENTTENNRINIVYTFCKNNQKFADLTVTKTGENSKHGFPLYKITSLMQYPLTYYTLIQNPGTTIYAQNTPIDVSYQTDREILASCFDQIGAAPFYKTTYHIPDYFLSMDLTVVDSARNACELIWNKDHTSATTAFLTDDIRKGEITIFSETVAKTYAIFATIKYTDKNSLLSYLYKDTAFYKAIRAYDNDWGITKTSDHFDTVSSSNIIKYSDTEYSCDVSLDYYVSQGNTEKKYPLHITCYITYQNGKPQIVNLEVH